MSATAQKVNPPAAVAGRTVQFEVHLRNGERGRKRLRVGARPAPQPIEPGRVPRISRLLALAIRFERLIHEGVVKDYADVARLGHVSRARVTQIMNLLNLAPAIQEEILVWPRGLPGRESVTERCVRAIAAESEWEVQNRIWLGHKQMRNKEPMQMSNPQAGQA